MRFMISVEVRQRFELEDFILSESLDKCKARAANRPL
jgi:hypothetical protein